jgi:hypothetical protein
MTAPTTGLPPVPPLPPLRACSSCGANIRWAKIWPSLKPHPIDAVPSADKGTLDLRLGTRGRTWYVRVLPKPEREGRLLYVSHFATCPQAHKHRRRA